MGSSVTALRLPPAVHDPAAFVAGDIAAIPPLGTFEQVRSALNDAFRRRGLAREESPSGLFIPEGVTDITFRAADDGQVRSLFVERADGHVIDVLAGLGLHVLDSGGFDIIAEPAAVVGTDAAAPAAPPATNGQPPAYAPPASNGSPSAYSAAPTHDPQTAYGAPVVSGQASVFGQPATAYAQPPMYAPGVPSAAAHPSPGGISAALIIEAVAAALTIGLIFAITASATAAGNGPPSNFLLAMFIVCAMVVLRTACMVLVRGGYGWARWIYLAVVVIGTGAMAGFPSLPIVNLLLLLAVVTTILVFLRRSRGWLRWRAAQRKQTA